MEVASEITYTIDELEKKLTKKERHFCHQYIIDWNASRSARDAGYSEKSAKEIGSENLTKPHIKQYINYIKDDIEKEAGISKLMAVNELKKFAFHNFDDIYDDWLTRKEFQSLPKEVKACIQEIDTKIIKKNLGTRDEPDIYDVEYVKIKLVDKKGAISDLAKMMGWNAPEKKELSGNIGIDDFSNTPTHELIKRANAIKIIRESSDS